MEHEDGAPLTAPPDSVSDDARCAGCGATAEMHRLAHPEVAAGCERWECAEGCGCDECARCSKCGEAGELNLAGHCVPCVHAKFRNNCGCGACRAAGRWSPE